MGRTIDSCPRRRPPARHPDLTVIAKAANAGYRPSMLSRVSVAILLTLTPAVAAGQVFGAGARTEFISGFGLRTFASVETRNRLLGRGTAAVDPGGPALRVRTTPVAIVYGLRARLSLVAVLPFVDKQLSFPGGAAQPFTVGAGGLGDALFLTKWRFYKRDQPFGTFQLATEVGVKAPTGAHHLEDAEGQLLPAALQRGSGSWDPMATLLMTYVPAAGRGRWAFTGDIGIRLTTEANMVEVGNQVGYDGMVKYRVHPVRYPGRDTFLLLEINGRWQDRARVGGGLASDSGGHVVYLSPGIQLLLRRNLILEGGVQVPVIHDLNGTQLAPSTRVLAGVRYIIVP